MILCAGEALIDMLPRETVQGNPAYAPHAGGAVFNTAIGLGRLDVPTQFFSGISTDLFGDILVDALAASKVDASPAERSDRPTTLAFVKLVDGQATYAFYDENTAGRMLDTVPDVQADAYFFGGISLAVEPCANTYEALQEKVAGTAVTMIDPNIRPSFIKDEHVYRKRVGGMVARADIVKMSDEDMEWLLGGSDMAAKAQDLIAEGVKLVCVTEGAKGVTGYTKNGATFVAADKVEVVDTVGAGDTFNAGLLAGLHRTGVLTKDGLDKMTEDQLQQALSLGARAAAVTVSRAGANPPWTGEV
ncbi:carbohydrate kinase family protein [Yoonia sp. 208BN28-4]|uniref:carbohydrate kinase family protein n=1 Tax=Yoonia sp. 208BN28-4 TaxID=3126505 RepID=UPI0030993BF3